MMWQQYLGTENNYKIKYNRQEIVVLNWTIIIGSQTELYKIVSHWAVTVGVGQLDNTSTKHWNSEHWLRQMDSHNYISNNPSKRLRNWNIARTLAQQSVPHIYFHCSQYFRFIQFRTHVKKSASWTLQLNTYVKF